MTLTGWRASGAAFVAGVLAALAMPPLYWLPLGVVGIAAFVWLWSGAATPRAALMRGWAWGTGHFAVGSYWIVEAFYVPPADFAPLGPPLVLGLALLLGLFPGLAAWASRRVVERWPGLAGRYSRLIVLAVAWTAAEWLRGHIFTGYPWNPLGHVWAFAAPLLQGAALFGVYGLGMLTFLVLAAPTAGWWASATALVVVALAGVAGHMTMAPIAEGGAWIRIVQPNVPQSQKWRPATRQAQLAQLVEMSRRPGFDRLAAVVWPETALPFVLEPGSPVLDVMASRRAARRLSPDRCRPGHAARPRTACGIRCWPSTAQAASWRSTTRSISCRFGEYIPFHNQLAPVSGFIGRGSFEVGERRVTLALPGLPRSRRSSATRRSFPAP